MKLRPLDIKNITKTDYNKRDGMRRAAIVSIQTTGVIPKVNKILEMVMLKMDYRSSDLSIEGVSKFYKSYSDPGFDIRPRVTEINRITGDMVLGQCIDKDEVKKFLSDVDLLITFNASWTVPFVMSELGDIFEGMPWLGISSEIDWLTEVGSVPSLPLLTYHFGYIPEPHLSMVDSIAMVEILKSNLSTGENVFSKLVLGAREKRYRISVGKVSSSKKANMADLGFRYSPLICVQNKGYNMEHIYYYDPLSKEDARRALDEVKTIEPSSVVVIGEVTPYNKYSEVMVMDEIISG